MNGLGRGIAASIPYSFACAEPQDLLDFLLEEITFTK